MSFVSSTCLTIALALLLMLSQPLQAIALPMNQVSAQPIHLIAQPTTAVLPGLKGVFASERPDNLGVADGHLAGCPATPNCVVSQGADADHLVAPIVYEGDRETARKNLIDILGVVPRTKIVEQRDDYILAESESRLMGFVDDSEFYFPEGEKVIQVRAAARLGESDLGVNRRRIEQIRLAFNDLTKRLNAS